MFKWIWSDSLNCYCAEHNHTIRADKDFNVFGGGGTETTVQSQAPSAGASTREAIQAEIETLPQRYETELKYRPQFTALDIQALEQYAPKVLGLQQEAARQEKSLQEELYPEQAAGETLLGQTITGGDLGGGFSPEEEEWYKEQFRGEEAAAGRLGSPVSSLNIANKLANLKEQRRAQRMGEILSYTGRTPVVGSQQFSPQTTNSQPTLTGGLTSSILGYAGQTYGQNKTQTSGFDYSSLIPSINLGF